MDVFSLRLREESIGIWEIRVLEFGEKVNCINCGCFIITRGENFGSGFKGELWMSFRYESISIGR